MTPCLAAGRPGETACRLRRRSGGAGRSDPHASGCRWPAPSTRPWAEITRTPSGTGRHRADPPVRGDQRSPAQTLADDTTRWPRRSTAATAHRRHPLTNYGRCCWMWSNWKATNIVGIDALATLFTPTPDRQVKPSPRWRYLTLRWPRWSTRSPPATRRLIMHG